MPDGATPDSAETDQLPTSQTVRLGVLLALVGGGLDAYTFVSRGGVFANAQTGNVVLMSVAAAQAHWRQALNHVPAIIAFVAGVITAESLKRPKVATLVRKPARAAIVLEIVVLLLVGFVPHNTLNSLVIILVAFTASVQVSTFRTLVDTPYATTMTTGNLRTAAQSAHRALADHDAEAARRTRQFGTIILAFILGALGGARLTATEGTHAVWVGAALLLLCLVLFVHDERVAARTTPEQAQP